MKNLDSKLFKDFEIENAKIVKIIGGGSLNTSVGSDTDTSAGGHDITFDTLNAKGKSVSLDVVTTDGPGGGTMDKPGC